jgi:hypothetical protein
MSTGPTTLEGIERIRRAKTKHEQYSNWANTERAKYRDLLRACLEMLVGL